METLLETDDVTLAPDAQDAELLWCSGCLEGIAQIGIGSALQTQARDTVACQSQL